MLLLDNSAWARLTSPRLDASRLKQIADWMATGELAVCLPFLLEAGYSARSGSDHRSMLADLARLPHIQIDEEIERLALSAQRQLADVGHHRMPPSDVLIATCAHRAGAGVLHYDRDYDVLHERTSLTFQSEWLSAPGTL